MKKVVKLYYFLDNNDSKKIKKQLIDFGWTYYDLSRRIGCSVAYISDLLLGKKYITQRIISQFEKVGILIDIN